VRDGGFASNSQIGRGCAGSWDENRNARRSSQVANQVNPQQKKPLLTLFSTALASNGLRNTRNPKFQRWRSTPVMQQGLTPMTSSRWLGQRSFSADAQSDSERKGLLESQIGEELLSQGQNQASAGAGLKLADGETLSPEEEAILKEAEAEFESAQQSKGAS